MDARLKFILCMVMSQREMKRINLSIFLWTALKALKAENWGQITVSVNISGNSDLTPVCPM